MSERVVLLIIIESLIIMGCECMAVKKGGASINSQIIQQRGKIAAIDDQIQALRVQKSVMQGDLASLKTQKQKGAK